jgi:hypothetical protein
MQGAGNDLPDRLDATPSRVQRLVELLGGRAAEARVLQMEHGGLVRSGSRPDAVMVGDVEVIVPANARITIRTRHVQPGIDVNSDNEPAPPGTWIWIGCGAVAECHEIFADITSA